MAIMTPSNTSNLNVQKWARTLEPALYDSMSFLPKLSEVSEDIMAGMYVRRLGTIPSQTLADTNDGETFNFDDVPDTKILLTPSWLIVALAYADSNPRRQGNEIKAAFAKNAEEALSAALDAYSLAFIQSSVTSTPIGGPAYNIDAAGLRSAVTQLATATKREIEPGDSGINLILDTGQISNALSIPEINQAYQRGDGKSPQLTGRITTGYGLEFNFTTLLTADGNGKHGAAYKGDFMKYGYNKRPGPEVQRYKKQTRVMVDAEIAANVIYNEKVVPIRTA